MSQHDLSTQAQFLSLVATEAVEETDAIQRHPAVVDVLLELAERDDLESVFEAQNGDDPAAFLRALADGLAPYRKAKLDDSPELVEALAIAAQRLQRATNGHQPSVSGSTALAV